MQRISQVHFAENVMAVVHFYSLGCKVSATKEQLTQKQMLQNSTKRYQKGIYLLFCLGDFFFSLGKAKNSIVKILKPWFNYTQDVQEHNLIRR